ncbi:MAG: 4Fe-4S dicluster domain-containing protein [Chloroflexota bacterium]
MVMDRPRLASELCRDCQACLLGCSLWHEGECNPQLARLRVGKDMARYVFTLALCRHCEDPACLAACPAEAMRLDERGVVLIDDEACLRCGACLEACPYEGLYHDKVSDRYLKCDLCAGRADGPLCAELCPVGAIYLEVSDGS